MTNPPCPNCDQELHINPKRKSRCKHCGKDVLVRSKGQLFGGRPLTAKEALAEDTFPVLTDRGVTVADYRRQLTAKFGE